MPTSPRAPSPADRRGLVYVYADESCLGNQKEEGASPGGAGGLIEVCRGDGTWHRRDFAHHDPDTTKDRMAITNESGEVADSTLLTVEPEE